MRASWTGSMQSALVATLARPDWWAMALAAFLVRGGIVVLLLPIVSLPSTAALATAIAPSVSGLVQGTPSLEGVVVVAIGAIVLLAALAGAGLVGSWLDLALLREAVREEELDLGWKPIRASPSLAFAVRLTAHLPTVLALGYASVRLVAVGYDELMSPGDASVPVVVRILERAPDAIVVVILAWLFGETVGALAARRAAAGSRLPSAFAASVRQVVGRRGLATLGLTSAVLLAIALPFLLAAGRAWEHLRTYLLEGNVDAVQLGAALVVLVATWVLGLAVVGAGLAWRASAWTSEVPQG